MATANPTRWLHGSSSVSSRYRLDRRPSQSPCHPCAVLVGRDSELAALDSCLDQAEAGRASTLRIVAEPGLGKTALLDEAARRAEGRGFRVVRVTAVEVESGIPAASLGIILRMLGSPADASATALLDAVLAESQEAPLLLTIDDAQWLDDISLMAVAFATRRLLADPVAVIIAGRPVIKDFPALAGIPLLDVPPLDQSAGVLLLRRAMPSVPDSTATSIVDSLGGVPLAIVDATRILTPEVLSGTAHLPSPLPVGRAIQDRYARGFAELQGHERFAIVLLAAHDSTDASVILEALAECGLGLETLQAGERLGLVKLGGAPQLTHPLARAAVHAAAEPSERRHAHEVLGRVCAARGDSDRSMLHRVAASIGPDADLADALERCARERLRQLGGDDEAVALALLGADVAVGTQQRCELLTFAAEHAAPGVALPLIGRVSRECDDPRLNARCSLRRARIDTQLTAEEKVSILSTLDGAALGPDLARQRDLELAWAYMDANDANGLIRFASRLDEAPDEFEDWDVLATCGIAFTFLGDHHRAVPLLRRAADLSRGIDPRSLPLTTVIDWAIIPGWLGDDAEHRRRFRQMNETLRATGRPEHALDAAFFMSERMRREGAWPMAESLLHEAIDLAQAIDANIGIGFARLASLLAYRGDELGTARAVASAEQYFDDSGERWHPLWLVQARGALELTLGRPERAVAALTGLASVPFLGRGARDAIALGLVDLVEAHTLAGSTEEAADTAHELDRRLNGIADPLGAALVARCRALTNPADADAYFTSAREQHRQTSEVFEEARTELHFGEHLRRTRRPKLAREPLARALAAFEHLHVDPWADRARRELRAAGAVVTSPSPDAAILTPQELRVALAVREGLTNDEVSGALFISVKTVEFHLGRVYRKLGIRSRGGLATALDRAGIG